MNPLGNRSRAEELARLLEGAVAGPASGTSGYAVLASRLRAVSPGLDEGFAPGAEFRAALRQRLLAVASVQAATAPAATTAPRSALDAARAWSQTWQAQRRLALTAGAMAAVVGFTGVGIASSRSLPGQPFYGLKRVAEGVQLDLAGSDTAKGTKHLEFAATRLREVQALADGASELALGSPGTPTAAGLALSSSVSRHIRTTLKAFDSETRRGRTLLEGVYRRTGKVGPLRVLSTFSTQEKHRLARLLPALPASAAPAAQASLDLVTTVGSTADQLLAIGTCTAGCNPDGAGPVLPDQPAPVPGASASPSGDNGVEPCTCPYASPEPSTSPSDEPTPTPAPSPSDEASGSPSPSPKPTPSPTPTPTPLLPLPTDLPTILPTGLPTILPTKLPPLPLPTILPTLGPLDAILP
jgi:hypothetical protein